MPRTRKDEAPISVNEPVIEGRYVELDEFTVSFETFPVASDPSPLFVGLPDDRCQCPHWGYVVHGSFSANYADGEETFHAGDAYYLRPGAEGEDARAAHLATYEAARRAADVGAMTEAALGLSRAQLFGRRPGPDPGAVVRGLSDRTGRGPNSAGRRARPYLGVRRATGPRRAEQWADHGRLPRLRPERDALLEQVAAATGLGGRTRTPGGSAERARIAVRKAITAAVERIGEVDPALADVLRRDVRTGARCRYDPEPSRPITWVTDRD